MNREPENGRGRTLPAPVVPVPRVSLRVPEEAATAIGCSVDFFDRWIRRDLRLIKRGRLTFVAVRELTEWAERNSARYLDR